MAGDELDRFLKSRRGGRASETPRPAPGEARGADRLEDEPNSGDAPETAETRPGVSGDGPVETDGDEGRGGGGCLVTISGGLATMLDLRFRDGRREAFPYSYLSQASFDPTGGITLRFAAASISITGRGLLAVHQAVTNQTAIAIVESPSGYDEIEATVFVASIDLDMRHDE